MTAKETAKAWRAFVMNPQTQTEAEWDEAFKAGLCVRRANRNNSGHSWVLTDAGLDLMIEGKE